MNVQLSTQLQRLNRDLDALERRLEKISHRELNVLPSPDAWSVLQVMQHLALSEKLSLQYLRKKTLSVAGIPKAGWSSAYRRLSLRLFLWMPLKFKAPAGVSEQQFPGEADFAEVMSEWRVVRQDLASFLENMPEEWLSLEIYKHPRAGRIPVAGMLEFFGGHFKRHQKQMERTLKVVNAGR